MASSRHFFATSAVIALAGPIEPNSVAASRMALPISPLIPGFKQVSVTIRCLHPITFPRSIGFLLLTLAGKSDICLHHHDTCLHHHDTVFSVRLALWPVPFRPPAAEFRHEFRYAVAEPAPSAYWRGRPLWRRGEF